MFFPNAMPRILCRTPGLCYMTNVMSQTDWGHYKMTAANAIMVTENNEQEAYSYDKYCS